MEEGEWQAGKVFSFLDVISYPFFPLDQQGVQLLVLTIYSISFLMSSFFLFR
jgi:hypothetical protein